MRALLLAAGLGKRLRPVTDTLPKCLVPIGGRPLIDYWFDRLFGSELVERVLVNTHYLSRLVENHVSHSPWAGSVDLIYETDLLGTAGTIKSNRSYFGGKDFLVAHADNLATFDLSQFANVHASRPAHVVMTMLTFRTDDPGSCGVVQLDASGVVVGFHEKVRNPPGNLANAAVYILTPEVVGFIASLEGSVIDFSTQIIPHFVGRIVATESHGYHRDVGTIESLRQANIDAKLLFKVAH